MAWLSKARVESGKPRSWFSRGCSLYTQSAVKKVGHRSQSPLSTAEA
jgi:hypothetical protein